MSWAIRELRHMWDETLGEPIDSFEAILARLEPSPEERGLTRVKAPDDRQPAASREIHHRTRAGLITLSGPPSTRSNESGSR
jgi:hypothetical protein